MLIRNAAAASGLALRGCGPVAVRACSQSGAACTLCRSSAIEGKLSPLLPEALPLLSQDLRFMLAKVLSFRHVTLAASRCGRKVWLGSGSAEGLGPGSAEG